MPTKHNILKMKDAGERFCKSKPALFDLPFRLLVVGKSQLSGKTNLVGNLLLRKQFYGGEFNGEDIFVVSPSTKTDHKLKVMLEQLDVPDTNAIQGHDEEVLELIYEMLEADCMEAVNNRRKPTPKLVLFDDMSYGGALKSKTHGIIAKLFSNGRHLNISTIVTAQKYSDISTSARENATGLALFGCTDKQLELISEDHNYLACKKTFKQIFRKVTDSKHSFMVVNYTNPSSERYMDSSFRHICTCADSSNSCKGIKILND